MSRQIRPLAKHKYGYLTADGRSVLCKTKDGWREIEKSSYLVKARDLENYYGVADFSGFRASSWSVAHKKLSNLIDELENKAPLFQIRPLRKWDTGSYRSYCGHFHVFKYKQKWRVELEMERSSLMIFDPSESELQSPRPWQTREIDWKSRHGILEGCDTLSELSARIERAVEIDPPMGLETMPPMNISFLE